MSNSFYFVTNLLISSLIELTMFISDCAELQCIFLHSQLASTSKIRHGLRLADGVSCLVLWAYPSTKMFFPIRDSIISALCILIRCIHSYPHLIFFLILLRILLFIFMYTLMGIYIFMSTREYYVSRSCPVSSTCLLLTFPAPA